MRFDEVFGAASPASPAKLNGLLPEDQYLSKIAGIDVYDPTIENIEKAVRGYLERQLTSTGLNFQIMVKVIPSTFLESAPSRVEAASGTASFTHKGVLVEFPFIVCDGSFVPFDVIQIGNQRIPFSVPNLKKILNGISAYKQREEAGMKVGDDRPYLGVDKAVNPSSSIGFLGSILSIQDQYAGNSGRSIYAGNNFRNDMVKISNLKPVDQNGLFDLIEKMATESIRGFVNGEAEKPLPELEKVAKMLDKMAGVNWVNANDQKHGTFISFPEVITGAETKEVRMSAGIVLSDFFAITIPNSGDYKVVLTQDNRIKILSKGEKMACIVANAPNFKIQTVPLSNLERKDIFMGFAGNTSLFPVKLDGVSLRHANTASSGMAIPSYDDEEASSDIKRRRNPFAGEAKELGQIYHLYPLLMNGRKSPFANIDGEEKNYSDIGYEERQIELCTLAGMKCAMIPYETFLSAKAEETGVGKSVIGEVFAPSIRYSRSIRVRTNSSNGQKEMNETLGNVFVSDPETQVIRISGTIDHCLENPAKLDLFTEDTKLTKEASAEYVELRSKDKTANTYSLKLVFTDKTKKLFSLQTKQFDNIEEYKARGILRACSLSPNLITELFLKASRQNYAKAPLPADATPGNVTGGAAKSMAAAKMDSIKNTLFAKDIKDDLAASLIAVGIGGAMSSLAPSALAGLDRMKIAFSESQDFEWEKLAAPAAKAQALDILNNFSLDASACSSVFEKQAMDKRSGDLREVASACALASHFYDKVASFLGTEDWYALDGIAGSICEKKPVLEKMAYDLTQLKVRQHLERDFQMNPSHIQQTVLALDNMYQTACAVKDAFVR